MGMQAHHLGSGAPAPVKPSGDEAQLRFWQGPHETPGVRTTQITLKNDVE